MGTTNSIVAEKRAYISDMKKLIPIHLKVYYSEEELTQKIEEHYHSEWLPTLDVPIQDNWKDIKDNYLQSVDEWRKNHPLRSLVFKSCCCCTSISSEPLLFIK